MSRLIAKATHSYIARTVPITASFVSRALNNVTALKTSTKKVTRSAAKKVNDESINVASPLRLYKTPERFSRME